MTTLPDFLRARLDEDEAVARAAMGTTDGQWVTWNRSWDASLLRDLVIDGERVCALPMTIDEHICAHDPARVLADVEAKRRIVEYETRPRKMRAGFPYVATMDADRTVLVPRWAANQGHDWYSEYAITDPEVVTAELTAWTDATTDTPTLRLLALPYADHPDYDERWRP